MEKLQPKLRFPEFEGNWTLNLFEDIYTFRTTNSLSREKLNYESGFVKNIHYGDIHKEFSTVFKIGTEKVPFINGDVDLSRIAQDNYCKNGDLIIADASEDYEDIGKSIEIVDANNEMILAGLHTFLARPDNKEMSLGFGGYLMKSNLVRKQIKLIAQGTKVLSLSTTRLAKIKTIVPQVEEQQKIASFLTAVDDKTKQLTKKKTLLEQYKKGVMEKIFNQELRFKDDDGNKFPEWKTKKISNVSKIYDGTHQTPDYVEQGIPFFSVEHVTANQFTKTKFITEEVFEKENKRVKLEKGDILMTRIGSIGVAKYINWDVKASFYVSLALIKQSENINNEYLCHFINTDFFQTELWKRTIHVAFPQKINLGEIGECLVKIPVLEEQTKIANFLSAIDDKINQVAVQLEKTTVFKKGLLQQMFC